MKYPDNTVLSTRGGITIELDSTEGKERINVFHPSGTYVEIDNEGNTNKKTTGNTKDILKGDVSVYCKGDEYKTNGKNVYGKTGGDVVSDVGNNLNVQVGIDCNTLVGGNIRTMANKKLLLLSNEVVGIASGQAMNFGGTFVNINCHGSGKGVLDMASSMFNVTGAGGVSGSGVPKPVVTSGGGSGWTGPGEGIVSGGTGSGAGTYNDPSKKIMPSYSFNDHDPIKASFKSDGSVEWYANVDFVGFTEATPYYY
jgi:hypothetical protein